MTDNAGLSVGHGGRQGVADDVCLHVIGRRFRTTRERAQAFLRHVETSTFRGRPELAPLLHSEGVDLLFVTSRTPMSMHDVRDRSFHPEYRHQPPSEDCAGQTENSTALTFAVATDPPARRA
jgi:hypothetical protein